VTPVDALHFRRCILGSIPERLYDEAVDHRFLFIPAGHLKALDPNRALVVGGRGTGKTFWWEVLASEGGAALLSSLFDANKEGLKYEVSVGYGAKKLTDGYPLDKDTLAKLFVDFPERMVWKAVVLASIAPERLDATGSWHAMVTWVDANPELYARVIAATDDELYRQKRRRLVVFDAIDRTGMSWIDVVRAHRALFGLLLDMWGTRAIRVKAFVRQDVFADPEVARFPDASKLQTAAVELRWAAPDLYGLLWQYLGNSREYADKFRALHDRLAWRQVGSRWEVPQELRSKPEAQQRLWHQLAGRWMGTDKRRGDTYRWLTNHLADAFEQVSPRSFLAAVRAAAMATTGSEEPFAITHKALLEGVHEAAEIRAREIHEDFPWADTALGALRELMVPCDPDEVLELWRLKGLAAKVDSNDDARPRRHHGSDLPGIIDDLVDLGMMERLRDDRINVPDVYRLRFGIKRKGGVPARRA
jgi:hypothetical protein